MSNLNVKFKRIDLETDLFQEAINFTAQVSGFNPELIEKDYFCSLVLSFLYGQESTLIFKGGTALNKVHLGFYRLSEDLDFSISMSVDSTRSQRSRAMDSIKKLFSEIPKALPGLKISSALTGRNDSLQYIGGLHYSSRLNTEPGAIQLEIGLREPSLWPVEKRFANTLLLDPVSGTTIANSISVRVHSRIEAYAEKLRAALTRRDPAIRDFFDIYHAVQNSILELADLELAKLTQQKLAVPGNDFIGLTPERIIMLKAQLESELRPVLQDGIYQRFDFEKCLSMVRDFEKELMPHL